MFTGIITDIGTVAGVVNNVIAKNSSMRATINCDYDTESIALGSSISHDGVCLTVVKINKKSYEVDISAETLKCTNLNNWKIGYQVNLERALKIGDELGGHLVSGHIDGIAELININNIESSKELQFLPPQHLSKFIVQKGSITINGVSLTVNNIINNNNKELFSVNIIPHTLQNTTLSQLNTSDNVNIEIDMLARYIQKNVQKNTQPIIS